MSRKRKQYTKEFKVETVKLVTEGGYSLAPVARDMGISTNMLRRWKKQFEENPVQPFRARAVYYLRLRLSAACKERIRGSGRSETS